MNKKIIIFLIINFPNKKKFKKAIKILYKNKVKNIEISIPEINTILDGKVIKKAYKKVYKKNIIKEFIKYINFLAKRFNIFIQINYKYLMIRNIKKTIYKNFKKIKGIIIPDIDKNIILNKKLKKNNFYVSNNNSIRNRNIYINICKKTGDKIKNNKRIFKTIKILRKKSKRKIKIMLGFGIRTIKQIRKFIKKVEYIVIGTKIIEIIKIPKLFKKFIKNVKNKT